MQVRMKQSMIGPELTLLVGDIYECGDAEAARLIEAGVAEPSGVKVERATAPAPVETAGLETATAPRGRKRGGE